MAQTKDGKLVEVGDTVFVEFTVKAVHEGEDFSKLDLVSASLSSGVQTSMTLNSHEVEVHKPTKRPK